VSPFLRLPINSLSSVRAAASFYMLIDTQMTGLSAGDRCVLWAGPTEVNFSFGDAIDEKSCKLFKRRTEREGS
jgi:hypothetical protein